MARTLTAFVMVSPLTAAYAQSTSPTEIPASVPAPTYSTSDLSLAARATEAQYDACTGAPVECLQHCKSALDLYNQAFLQSRDSDLAPLRAGKALAQRCKQKDPVTAAERCSPGDPQPSDACGYLFDFDVSVRFTRPIYLSQASSPPRPQPWWDSVQHGETSRLLEQHQMAADLFTTAYDRCQRMSFNGSDHCIPLVREALQARQHAFSGTQPRQRIQESLALVERELKADDRTCQKTNNETLRQVCTIYQELLVLYAVDLLRQRQFRDAADSFEKAYGSCISRGEPVPDCWASFGRPAWSARHNLLIPGNISDSEQQSRAVAFLTRFVLDMKARCDDPALPKSVAGVCHDLRLLQQTTPSTPLTQATKKGSRGTSAFIGFAIPGDPTRSVLASCAGVGPSGCWSSLRARTIDRVEALRDATDPAVREQIARAGNQDIQTFLEQSNGSCRAAAPRLDARACGLSQVLKHTVQQPLPKQTPTPRTPPDRRLVAPGAVSVTLGGLSLATMAAGMILGSRANAHFENNPSIGGQLRADENFEKGELGNRLSTAGSILGVTFLTVGIVLLAVDARNHRSRRVTAGLDRFTLTF